MSNDKEKVVLIEMEPGIILDTGPEGYILNNAGGYLLDNENNKIESE